MPPDSVHFNGSVNLPDAETVMREISTRIPRGVRRMTDGETGERHHWITFQLQKFAAMPDFQPAGMREVPGADLPPRPLLRLADGVAAEDIRWPDLGYAAAYTDSYQVFRRLQDDGTIPPGVRFQVQYPTPSAPFTGTFVPEEQDRLAASYQAALFADLDRALAQLPPEQVAVQWGMWPSNSRCWKAALAPRGSRWRRSRRAWSAAPTRYPATCRSACTYATATAGTSTSNNRSHWPCRFRWPTP